MTNVKFKTCYKQLCNHICLHVRIFVSSFYPPTSLLEIEIYFYLVCFFN